MDHPKLCSICAEKLRNHYHNQLYYRENKIHSIISIGKNIDDADENESFMILLDCAMLLNIIKKILHGTSQEFVLSGRNLEYTMDFETSYIYGALYLNYLFRKGKMGYLFNRIYGNIKHILKEKLISHTEKSLFVDIFNYNEQTVSDELINLEHICPQSHNTCGIRRLGDDIAEMAKCLHDIDPFNMIYINQVENLSRGNFKYDDDPNRKNTPYFKIEKNDCKPFGKIDDIVCNKHHIAVCCEGSAQKRQKYPAQKRQKGGIIKIYLPLGMPPYVFPDNQYARAMIGVRTIYSNIVYSYDVNLSNMYNWATTKNTDIDEDTITKIKNFVKNYNNVITSITGIEYEYFTPDNIDKLFHNKNTPHIEIKSQIENTYKFHWTQVLFERKDPSIIYRKRRFDEMRDLLKDLAIVLKDKDYATQQSKLEESIKGFVSLYDVVINVQGTKYAPIIPRVSQDMGGTTHLFRILEEVIKKILMFVYSQYVWESEHSERKRRREYEEYNGGSIVMYDKYGYNKNNYFKICNASSIKQTGYDRRNY